MKYLVLVGLAITSYMVGGTIEVIAAQEKISSSQRECAESDYSCRWTEWANDQREYVCALKPGVDCVGGVTAASLYLI